MSLSIEQPGNENISLKTWRVTFFVHEYGIGLGIGRRTEGFFEQAIQRKVKCKDSFKWLIVNQGNRYCYCEP